MHKRTRGRLRIPSQNRLETLDLRQTLLRYGACYDSLREGVMEAMVQVGGAVLGLGVGLAAARLALAGVLAATFGRR